MSIPLRLENDRSDEFANFLETKRKREEDERRRQNILRSTRSQAQAINQRAKTARIDARRRAMNVNAPVTPQFMRDQMNARAAQKKAVASARASGLPNDRLSAVPMNAPSTQPVATTPTQPAPQPVAAPLERTPEQEAQLALDLENAAIQNRRNYTAGLMGPVPPTDYLSEGARQMLPPNPVPSDEEIDQIIGDNANRNADLVDEVVSILSGPQEFPVDEEVIPANMMMSSYPEATDYPEVTEPGVLSSAFGPYGAVIENMLNLAPVNNIHPQDIFLPGTRIPSEEERAVRVQELIDEYTPEDTDPLAAFQRSAIYDAARERLVDDIVNSTDDFYTPDVAKAMSTIDSMKIRRLMEDATYGEFDELLDLVRRGDY